MKKALDKAASNLQWSQGSMLIDKKTLKPADPAVVPLERLVHLPIPDKLDMAAHFGANWYRNNVWHKPDEKPDRSREPILQLHRDMSAGTLFFSMLKGEEEVKMMTSYIVAWCYFEDLLPQWIKVYDYDKQNTKKCVLRDDELEFD